MLRVLRQLVVATSWSVTAVVLSGLALAQVPATSSALRADIISSVNKSLSQAADRALTAALASQFWMTDGDTPSKRPETPIEPDNSVLKLRAAIDRVNKLKPIVEPILRREGVPVELSAVILVESGGLPAALSPKGARGVWQFMPNTARRYGLVVSGLQDDRLDLYKSTHAAAFLASGTQQVGMIRETGRSDSDFLTTVRALHWLKC